MKPRIFLKTLIPFISVLLLLFSACPSTDNQDVSFKDEILPVFQAQCVRCHNSEAASFNNLNLSSYESLINGNSLHQSDLIIPGYPSQSLLYLSVTDEPPAIIGYRMPKDGPPYLLDIETQSIEDWIYQGAKNN